MQLSAMPGEMAGQFDDGYARARYWETACSHDRTLGSIIYLLIVWRRQYDSRCSR
jgi:hypothetical protein